MLTIKDVKPKQVKRKATKPKAKPAPVKRVVERMISAYMSYIKDNPGGK